MSPPATGGPRGSREENVEVLARLCAEDLLDAFGLGGIRGAAGRALAAASLVPARRLAEQVATYDEIVGESGLGAGGTWALGRMAREVRVEGREHLPGEGPLLVVSNHPGLADAVALFSAIPREDLTVLAAKRPFLEALPNTSRRLLTVAEDGGGRSSVARAAARRLKAGGAVLTFPAGRIEPDPALRADAAETSLEGWSASADLFARLVPGLTVVPAAVGGVVSPAALRNPLVFVRRGRKEREWLAATIQMLVPVLRRVATRVEFGTPVRAGDGPVGPAVEREMRRLFARGGRP